MNKYVPIRRLLLLITIIGFSCIVAKAQSQDLAGEWRFQADPSDEGIGNKWFEKKLTDKVRLPGSMTTNNKGNDITVSTPWTGSTIDSSWYLKPEYAKYRQQGNIKVPFWLQPVKYYKGAAWYQRDIEIPSSWKGKRIELVIERSHWETTVWIDDKNMGMQNSLSTAQVFDLSEFSPGRHRLTIRVDNRVKDLDVGQNSHSISDHTQTNWNGMIGKLQLRARPAVYIDQVRLYPDVAKKQVIAKVRINNQNKNAGKAKITLFATHGAKQRKALKAVSKNIDISASTQEIEIVYPMGADPLLWDEFHPNVYSMNISISGLDGTSNNKNILFGMREFIAAGTQFTVNGNRTFLRGTLECAIFPLTGFPPTDTGSWMKIYRVVKSYGLNHVRFHSWCPPEAAFEAADRVGVYLQVECASWANWSTTIGDGKPVDKYIMEESERIVNDYGNHPSFCMLAYGNEPGGKNQKKYLSAFVDHWKAKDNRRVYTSGAGWPVVPENEFHVVPEPRIQLWGAGLASVINKQAPRSDYDWKDIIDKWKVPTVSHEIGQWCVYPDFKEIKKYKGVLKAKNFEIFQERLVANGLGQLADSFLLASGKLQALCYKADIEAALRTPGFGGFQLLDLHDFPGQGTALVGVLNPFWEDKGYITAKEYSRFCNATVPLARFPKMIYRNNETLMVPVELAHFDPALSGNITPVWTISDRKNILFKGSLPHKSISPGNAIPLGTISQSLATVTEPTKLLLTVSVGKYKNDWEFFVYPAVLPSTEKNILVTQQLDDDALAALNNGGKVLLTLPNGSVGKDKGGSIAIGFSSIFWNTAWTKRQAPHTLGILCDPKHPAFRYFPTDYYSNWQWWDAMSHSSAVMLDSVSKGIRPIVRVVDDWVTNRSLGLVFECKVGPGKLLVSSIDLLQQQDERPEAQQLLFSLKKYMETSAFEPSVKVDADTIRALTK